MQELQNITLAKLKQVGNVQTIHLSDGYQPTGLKETITVAKDPDRPHKYLLPLLENKNRTMMLRVREQKEATFISFPRNFVAKEGDQINLEIYAFTFEEDYTPEGKDTIPKGTTIYRAWPESMGAFDKSAY